MAVYYRKLNGKFGSISTESVVRASKYVVLTGVDEVDYASIISLEMVRDNISKNIANDLSKYSLPECYKTSLVSTVNARALQNFLSLRTDKHALAEIQVLAHKIYEAIPTEHKFLFEDSIKLNTKGDN